MVGEGMSFGNVGTCPSALSCSKWGMMKGCFILTAFYRE
jgi:hypothetical protein